jgi:HEAT repeat protein
MAAAVPQAPATPAPTTPSQAMDSLLDEELSGQPSLSSPPSSAAAPTGRAPDLPAPPAPAWDEASRTLPPAPRHSTRADGATAKLVIRLVVIAVLSVIGFIAGRAVVSAIFEKSVGKAGGVDGDEMAERAISISERIMDLLSTITDAESLREAMPELDALESERVKCFSDFQVFHRNASPEQHRLMDKKYGRELNEIADELAAEKRRVRQIYGGSRAHVGLPADDSSDVSPWLAQPAPERTSSDTYVREQREEVERALAESRRSRQERIQSMTREHGAEKLAIVEFDGLGTHLFQWIREELGAITDAEIVLGLQPNNNYSLTLAPVDDLQALASKLDYGEVVKIDTQRRVILLKVDQAKVPAPLLPEVRDASAPRFFRQNLADLTCFDTGRRCRACERFVKIEPNAMQSEVTQGLEDCLRHRQTLVRSAAAKALLKWATSENVPAMVKQLEQEEDNHVAGNLADALAPLKDERSAEAVAALMAKGLHFRVRAAKPLKAMGSVAETAVAKYTSHSDPEARRVAIEVLAEVATSQSVPKLVEILEPKDPFTATRILEALGRIKDERAIAPVVALLVDARALSTYVSDCLKAYGPPAQKAVAELLTHESQTIRGEALTILDEIATEETVPELIEYVTTGPLTYRRRGLSILGRIKDERAIVPVAELLLDRTSRSYAAECLKQFGPAAEETVLIGLKHPDSRVVVECCEILAEIGTHESLDPLLRLTRHRDITLRSAAQKAGQTIIAREGPPTQAKPAAEKPPPATKPPAGAAAQDDS